MPAIGSESPRALGSHALIEDHYARHTTTMNPATTTRHMDADEIGTLLANLDEDDCVRATVRNPDTGDQWVYEGRVDLPEIVTDEDTQFGAVVNVQVEASTATIHEHDLDTPDLLVSVRGTPDQPYSDPRIRGKPASSDIYQEPLGPLAAVEQIDREDVERPAPFTPGNIALDDPAVRGYGNALAVLADVPEETLTSREQSRHATIRKKLDKLEEIVKERKAAEARDKQRPLFGG